MTGTLGTLQDPATGEGRGSSPGAERPAHPTGRPAADSRTPLVALILAGLALALVLAGGFLLPLALWEHNRPVPGFQPLAELYGLGVGGRMRYVAAVFAAYAVFGAAVFLAFRVSGRRGFGTVLAGTALLALTLIPTNPAGAQDIYHNVVSARTLWVHGDNPGGTPPSAHPDDPLFRYLSVWEDTPSAYGPLWYIVAGLPVPFVGPGLWANVIGQKALTALFLVAAAALAMLTVGRWRPQDAVAAGVLVGWNPLLLFETAGNAHNDILMITFGLAALYALARGWWRWVFPMLALAVAVKYVFALAAPLVLLWMLRRGVPRREVALSVAAGAATGLLLYVPYLADGSVIDRLNEQAGQVISSTGAALASLMMVYGGLEAERAIGWMKGIMVGLFVAGYVAALVVVAVPRRQVLPRLAEAMAWMLFLFLITVAWWFWPWYLIWLVPVAALTPHRPVAWLAAAFSLTGMLLYAAYYWQVFGDWHETMQTTAAVVFVAPLWLAAVIAISRLARGRLPGRSRRAVAGG